MNLPPDFSTHPTICHFLNIHLPQPLPTPSAYVLRTSAGLRRDRPQSVTGQKNHLNQLPPGYTRQNPNQGNKPKPVGVAVEDVASLQDLEQVSSFYTRDSAELRPGLICCAPSGQSGKHLANSVNHRHNGSMIRIQHTVNLVSDRSDLLDGTGGVGLCG